MAKYNLERSFLAALLLWLLLGCGQEATPWHGHNIQGLMPELKFHLTDENGLPADAARYTGKLALLYFGFTHCKDACPTTLTTLAGALERLGPAAAQVQILFVSVDPQRDTPAVLRDYTNRFAPQVVGLTGTQDELQALSKRYRVSFSYGEPDAKGGYEVYHSSAIFVFDKSGQVRLLLNAQEGATAIAEDLERLLKAGDHPQVR